MTCRGAIALAVMVTARLAAADPVTVKVTEVAGGVAFVTPGRAAGLIPGTKVRFRGRDFAVFEVTEKTAAIKLTNGGLAAGDTGSANVTPGGAAAAEKLAKPRPPETFVGQWPEAVVPALTQSPEPVPLGSGRRPGHAHVTVIGRAFGASTGSDRAGELEGRVIASFDLMNERPLAGDVDAALRITSRDVGGGPRTPIYVRTAQLRYGDAIDPRFALGRLRFAAATVGMLDGGRASARFGTFELGAFGGIVPDPTSGKPDTSAARFGAEAAFDDPASTWQPRVAVTAHGSTWTGKVDERIVSVVASAGHDSMWLDGWAEAQSFPSGNPWNAKAVELTGAGATAEWRKHGRHLGVDFTFLRPERSLRLASVLPPEWLCTLAPQPGNVAETCSGSDYWAAVSGSTGIRTSRFALDAIGSFGRTHGVYKGYDASGYLRGEVHVGPGRLEAGFAGGRASFASWMAGDVGVGFAPIRKVDVAARYRLELLDYAASTGPYRMHSLIGDGHYTMSTVLDAVGSLIITTGPDRDAVALLATLVWRPLP
jgi:hypothetical protein